MNLRYLISTIAILVLSPALGFAQERAQGAIKTASEDLGYGEHELEPQARFPKLSKLRGRVDRRSALNPLANRSIAWSSGYLPSKGTIQIQSIGLLRKSLAYSLTDELQIQAEASLPIAPQIYLGLGAQGQVAQGDAWKLAVGGTLRHRSTRLFPGTNDTGLTLDAVFDVIGTDNLTWNAGISLHVPLHHSVEIVDSRACTNRRELAEGDCIEPEAQARFMPNSGYWVAAYAGMNYFVTDWLLFSFELFTGASQGNFMIVETLVESLTKSQNLSYSEELELVESTRWSGGLGPIGPLGMGMGTTWIYRRIAINGSLILMSYRSEPELLPFISIGLNLGG